MMGFAGRTSSRTRVLGIVLIVMVGVLNFHVPHFVIEPARSAPAETNPVVELLFLTSLNGALVAAVGIFRNERWGWRLGIMIVGTSICLYVAQETVGLPGMPIAWLEPSRLVSVLIDGVYVAVAWRPGLTLEAG